MPKQIDRRWIELLAMVMAIATAIGAIEFSKMNEQVHALEEDIKEIQVQSAETETQNEALTLVYGEENPEVNTFIEEPCQIVTIENIELIERVVAAEARGDSFRGMVAVANCIKDRGDMWGLTYEQVVLQPGQFAAPFDGYIDDDVSYAVELVFFEGVRATYEPILHFHSTSVNPSWAEGKASLGSLGSRGHVFYKD